VTVGGIDLGSLPFVRRMSFASRMTGQVEARVFWRVWVAQGLSDQAIRSFFFFEKAWAKPRASGQWARNVRAVLASRPGSLVDRQFCRRCDYTDARRSYENARPSLGPLMVSAIEESSR